MQPKDKTKLVTFDEEAHLSLAKGIEIMDKAVGSTYGPGGRNVLVKKKYINPLLTRDGVTVAREIGGHGNKLDDPIATEAAKLVYEASEKTNKTAGDGTTGTVVLLAALYKSGRQRVVAGEDPMLIRKQLYANRDAIVKYLESKTGEVDKKKLCQVATISSGDDNLGVMISDLMHEVGADGSVSLEYQNSPHVEIEKVTGYLFNNGFRHLAVTIKYLQPLVFVTQKRMVSQADIVPILNIMAEKQRQFVIVGDVSGAAMETLMWGIQKQKADGLVVPPPAFGDDGHDFFEDIATYTGAKLWMESDNFAAVTVDDFGEVKSSEVSSSRAILFGQSHISHLVEQEVVREVTDADGTTQRVTERQTVPLDINLDDAVTGRIKVITEQLAGDMTTGLQEKLEKRRAKLAGKVSIIKVGAATETERDELFYRVEDAVESCKSALSSGIVAGCATSLLFASTEPGLENYVRDALRKPFRLLMENSAEDSGYRLQQTLAAGYGKGFNLRKMTDGPVDLLKDGIVDPTKVVVQLVQNAFSTAGALLTMGATITEVDDEKDDPQS